MGKRNANCTQRSVDGYEAYDIRLLFKKDDEDFERKLEALVVPSLDMASDQVVDAEAQEASSRPKKKLPSTRAIRL